MAKGKKPEVERSPLRTCNNCEGTVFPHYIDEKKGKWTLDGGLCIKCKRHFTIEGFEELEDREEL